MNKNRTFKIYFIGTISCAIIITIVLIIITVIDILDGSFIITLDYIFKYIPLIFVWCIPISIKIHFNKEKNI